MNDTEWLELRALWQAKKAELPADVQRYARGQKLGLWLSNLIFWPIAAGECGFAVWILTHGPGWQRSGTARLDAWVILGFVAPMAAWYLAMQRRLWPNPLETPNEMLSRFERHLDRGRLAGWLGAGGFFVLTLFVLAQAVVLRGGVGAAWRTDARIFVWAGVGFATFLLYPRLLARYFRRKRARIERWRQGL